MPAQDEGHVKHNEAFLAAVDQMQAPALYLVGGFEEPSGTSHAVCHAVLDMAHRATGQRRLELRLACIGAANTVLLETGVPSPASHHLAVDCATGAAYPACFEHRGPELPRRFGHQHCVNRSDGLLQVASPCGRNMRLPGFSAKLPAWHLHYLASLLSLRDNEAFLLKTSTSPNCERDSYVADVRGAFRWLLESQSAPLQPSLVFEWSGGQWVKSKGCDSQLASQHQHLIQL